jgi:DNA-binding NarL/FixJ family response regulator
VPERRSGKRIDAAVRAALDEVMTLPADERYRALDSLTRQLRGHSDTAARVRAEVVASMRAEGKSIGEIARTLGLSKTRIVQILRLPYAQ